LWSGARARILARMNALARAARATAEAMFSTSSGPAPPERIDWLCSDFADFVRQAGARSEAIMRASLTLANWVAPLTVGKRPPLSRLSLPERCLALGRVEGSLLGLGLLAAKAILCAIYYEHPDARRAIGVDDGCLLGAER
jgi:predicted outer membrane lipoprotein